jgi:hypothetical protein
MDSFPSRATIRSLWIVVLMSAVASVSSLLSHQAGIDRTRNQAIEASVARWDIDPRTGEREFTWGSARCYPSGRLERKAK